MNNQELIKQLLFDLRKYSTMKNDLYIQKCEALRTLYVREDDFSHALGINLEMRKKINLMLPSKNLMINERKRLLKTLTCRSIDSGLTGATRCEVLAYADDMVSGSEEALNRERMDILWTKFTNDFMSRMKQDCKMLIIGTRWSIHDPIGRLKQRYFDDSKSKFVKLPALNIHGNSNFEYDHNVGFSTDYFLNLKENMDDISWRAIYLQEPVEREGLLYSYFFFLEKKKKYQKEKPTFLAILP